MCLLRALEEMNGAFPAGREDYLERYRAHCLTVGRRVSFETGEGVRSGTAQGIDDYFALRETEDGGGAHTVSSGTVKLL